MFPNPSTINLDSLERCSWPHARRPGTPHFGAWLPIGVTVCPPNPKWVHSTDGLLCCAPTRSAPARRLVTDWSLVTGNEKFLARNTAVACFSADQLAGFYQGCRSVHLVMLAPVQARSRPVPPWGVHCLGGAARETEQPTANSGSHFPPCHPITPPPKWDGLGTVCAQYAVFYCSGRY